MAGLKSLTANNYLIYDALETVSFVGVNPDAVPFDVAGVRFRPLEEASEYSSAGLTGTNDVAQAILPVVNLVDAGGATVEVQTGDKLVSTSTDWVGTWTVKDIDTGPWNNRVKVKLQKDR